MDEFKNGSLFTRLKTADLFRSTAICQCFPDLLLQRLPVPADAAAPPSLVITVLLSLLLITSGAPKRLLMTPVGVCKSTDWKSVTTIISLNSSSSLCACFVSCCSVLRPACGFLVYKMKRLVTYSTVQKSCGTPHFFLYFARQIENRCRVLFKCSSINGSNGI